MIRWWRTLVDFNYGVDFFKNNKLILDIQKQSKAADALQKSLTFDDICRTSPTKCKLRTVKISAGAIGIQLEQDLM